MSEKQTPKQREEKSKYISAGTWKPGQSGNPKGRPKSGGAYTDIMRELGEVKDAKHGKEKITRKRAVIEKLYDLAIKDGKEFAIKILLDRIEGPVVKRLEVDSDVPLDAPAVIIIGGEQIPDDDSGDSDTAED